jgi:hypothetical protein
MMSDGQGQELCQRAKCSSVHDGLNGALKGDLFVGHRDFDAEAAHPSVKRRTVNAQTACGGRDVPLVLP